MRGPGPRAGSSKHAQVVPKIRKFQILVFILWTRRSVASSLVGCVVLPVHPWLWHCRRLDDGFGFGGEGSFEKQLAAAMKMLEDGFERERKPGKQNIRQGESDDDGDKGGDDHDVQDSEEHDDTDRDEAPEHAVKK